MRERERMRAKPFENKTWNVKTLYLLSSILQQMKHHGVAAIQTKKKNLNWEIGTLGLHYPEMEWNGTRWCFLLLLLLLLKLKLVKQRA